MDTSIRITAIAVVCSGLAIIGNAGLRAEPAPTQAPQPHAAGKHIVPEGVFLAIVKESAGFIKATLPEKLTPNALVSQSTIRGNALLIALAAQNRLRSNVGDTEAAKLATLRDAAIRLSEVIKRNSSDTPELRKLIDILHSYPDIQLDANASTSSVRLTDTFDHDDVASDFGGCSGNKTQRLERTLSVFLYRQPRQFTHQQVKPLELVGLQVPLLTSAMLSLREQPQPFTPQQVTQLELLTYKFALIGDIFPELYDFIPPKVAKSPELRKEWSNLARDVHTKSWELTETVRSGTDANIRAGLASLDNTCMKCHDKFRE